MNNKINSIYILILVYREQFRVGVLNNRAKCIHRDIKRKLHVVDQKWNQSADKQYNMRVKLGLVIKKQEKIINNTI